MSGALAQKISPEQFESISNLIGDLFTFRDLDLILYKCSGDRKINDIAEKTWPPRQTARESLAFVEREGTVKAFLSMILEAQPSNAELRARIQRAMPELAAAARETKANVDLVVSSLNDTRQGLRDPAVRSAVATSRETLTTFASGVAVLDAYKNLHDCLHWIQVRRFYDLPTAASAMAADTAQVDKLKDFQVLLQTCVSLARPWAEMLPDDALLRATELAWIDKLQTAADKFQEAVDDRDTPKTRLMLRVVALTLEREPPRLNALIFLIAKRLPVQELIAALDTAGALDPAAKSMLTGACEALREIRATLVRRVVDHHLWQDADDGLWALDRVFAQSGNDVFGPFSLDWPAAKFMVKDLAETARDSAWAKAIVKYSDRVDDALTRAEGETGADGQGSLPKAIRDEMYLHYIDFRHEVRLRFFLVDQLLKRDCTAIVAIGAPLQSILRALDDG